MHNPEKRNADPIADPHDYVVKKYRELHFKLLKPALDTIAVRRENIYTASLDDDALYVMTIMNKNTFTHVPIIEDESKG